MRSPEPPRAAGSCGLADLVRVVGLGDEALVRATVGLLDDPALRYRPPRSTAAAAPAEPPTSAATPAAAQPSVVRIESNERRAVPFWQPLRYTPLAEIPEPRTVTGDDTAPIEWPPFRVRPHRDLAPWRVLQPRLRGALGAMRHSRDPDTEQVVRRIERGERIVEVPRRRYRGWGSRVHVVIDRSDHLIPYWEDQRRVAGALLRLLPSHVADVVWLVDGAAELERTRRRASLHPSPGALILVLGDLGTLALDGGVGRAAWRRQGHRWHQAGSRCVALLPCHPGRCPPDLGRLFELLAWERVNASHPLPPDARRSAVRQLLTLLSPAVRIEPALVRDLRLALGADAPEAGVEAELWQDPAVTARSSVAATLDPDSAAELRQRFRQAPRPHRAAALRCLRAARAHLPREIWCEELTTALALDQAALLPEPGDIDAATRFWERLSRQGRGIGAPPPAGALGWYQRTERRLPEQAWADPATGAALQRLTWALHKDEPGSLHASRVAPEHSSGDGVVRRWPIRQAGDRLVATAGAGEATEGSLLAAIPTRSGQCEVRAMADVDTASDAFWANGEPPDWATAWGWDEHGAWVEIAVAGAAGEVCQRMRWIPPGEFLMGSPADEPGRSDNEGPQHPVRLDHGYWLFDTPCTQALWQAVTGENPSGFRSPDRPVEQVSWDDCQSFLAALNQRLPGLALSLPTEAQWEHACRAGTDGATYEGTYELLGSNDVPALDPIAWYGGNSALDFELDNGVDCSGWVERQHLGDRAGSHPVARKRPNQWGLYDMLGNVWEWCADGQRRYGQSPMLDPSDSTNAGESRMVRGGSWRARARGVRCASRRAYPPALRNLAFGFRPARVHPREPGQQVADPARPAIGRQAGRRPMQGAPGEAVRMTLRGDEGACAWPRAGRFTFISDVARLDVARVARPTWASAMGRDRFGLWAAFDVPGLAASQRLRWIPPGRFEMGSPEDEPGRIDREGPRHEVVLTDGYWLLETPCTQALWEAVTGEKPSRFRSPDRPVEQVDWEDCLTFFERLEEVSPGLSLTLPTEAQWEHASRAGADTALYAGGLDGLGDANGPALDACAWYGGNSNVGFELDNGVDIAYIQHRRYGRGPSGTHPVRLKLPNGHGLYDMLGNVFEWCLDGMRDYATGSAVNPVGEADAGAWRVVRGGSWYVDARDVRCAARGACPPGFRDDSVGFRPARVHP